MNQTIVAPLMALYLASACSHTPESNALHRAPPQTEVTESDVQSPGSVAAPEDSEYEQPVARLSRDEAYRRLLSLSKDQNSVQKIPENHQEFSVMLPVVKPRTSATISSDEDWHWNKVTVFFENPDKVDQIAIEAAHCSTPESTHIKRELEARIRELVPLVSGRLFDKDFELPENTHYFKELGPNWKRWVRVPIREDYAPAQRMRLMRGFYKCDGRSGFGFRYDFFL